MKRNLLWLAVAMLQVTALVYADHIPQPPEGGADVENHVRIFLTDGRLTPAAELLGRWDDRGLGYRSLTLGGYYRASRNVKIGAFYRVQQGVLHDDDWIDLNPGWGWRDTRDRTEHLFLLDFSPRFLLDFLPGRSWVLMLKNRYLYNTFNAQQTLEIRPGITYFLLRGREPFFNFSAQYALYVPLNFGSSFTYERYPYVNVLYHASPIVKADFSAAYRTVTWSTSEDAAESGGAGYSVDSHALVLGLGVILQFGL
jgi:hypothetical protein